MVVSKTPFTYEVNYVRIECHDREDELMVSDLVFVISTDHDLDVDDEELQGDIVEDYSIISIVYKKPN